MIRPKYKFYIGPAITDLYFSSNTGINDKGELISDTGKYTYGMLRLSSDKAIFIDLKQTNRYSAVFFYDSLHAFISYKIIADESIIVPPANAEYYAIRFDGDDENFKLKKDTKFVYLVEPVTPYYKSLSKKYAKESNQEFFRTSLEGQISFKNPGYKLIKNSSLNDKLIFVICKYSHDYNKFIEYYRGQFSKTDCTIDHEQEKCEIKVSAIDKYIDILNNYENTYDLIKLAPEISKIDLHKRALIQIYIRGANSITNLFGGTYWEDDTSEAVDDNDLLINKYHFSYVKSGNEFYINNASIPEVNGVYAGIDGQWKNWNGYTCYHDVSSTATDYIYIKRDSDDVAVYRSVSAYPRPSDDPNNIFISNFQDIKMIGVDDPNDSFVLKKEDIFLYPIYQRLLCDVDSIQDSSGLKNTYDLPIDDFVVDNRNYKKCIGIADGLFFCTSRTVMEPTKYGINDYNRYFTNDFIPATSGLGRPLPISKSSWANASLWYVYDDLAYESLEERTRKKYTLKNSYSIAAVIKAILKKIDPTLTHEATAEYSRFLYDTEVPIPMDRFYVYITQKTNILKGDYDQPAQKAEIKFSDLMAVLRDCFRCYWYIEDNKFKIEHISFFMNGGSYASNKVIQYDFTKLIDQFNKKKTSYFQSKIEFDKSDLSQRYEFSWMDDATELFTGITLDVNSNYVQKDKVENISISQFSSDVDFMLFNPSDFSNDGFALLCPVINGSSLELPILMVNDIVDENGDKYSAIAQNWYASWLYLVNFYMYDMPGESISYNSFAMQAKGIKKCMEHAIEFTSEEDPDEMKLIKTDIGDGKIDEISINIDTRLTQVKLLYEPK